MVVRWHIVVVQGEQSGRSRSEEAL